MKRYEAAVDIGATSGRLLLSSLSEEGKRSLEEVHRFKTPLVDDGGGHCHWDAAALFAEILAGLKKCRELGKEPYLLGIDSFGVDYALLDENDHLIGDVVSYRDARTSGVKDRFMAPERLFELTGIQPMEFNSVYQLYLDRESGKLKKAKGLLFFPCYLAYLLTGKKVNELSIASTSGLLVPGGGSFSEEILAELGLTPSFFYEVAGAGTPIGHLKEEVKEAIGFDLEVRAALSHDTAAAFLGSLAREGEILISSGTWSLIGVLNSKPCLSKEAFEKGFSNELSRPGEVRFLKNISGMWMANRLKAEILPDEPITKAVELARKSSYEGHFDPTANELMNPSTMKEALDLLLRRGGYPLPKTPGDYFKAVYVSLAKEYARSAKELARLTSMTPRGVRIFGGGSKNLYLNELTAVETGLPVFTGPSEATGLGNILSIL